jgi:enamine deaminase RidA (YjgF/YER057c/UK114 family)
MDIQHHEFLLQGPTLDQYFYSSILWFLGMSVLLFSSHVGLTEGRAFDGLTIQGQSQAALTHFKTEFLQMGPKMAQSLIHCIKLQGNHLKVDRMN